MKLTWSFITTNYKHKRTWRVFSNAFMLNCLFIWKKKTLKFSLFLNT